MGANGDKKSKGELIMIGAIKSINLKKNKGVIILLNSGIRDKSNEAKIKQYEFDQRSLVRNLRFNDLCDRFADIDVEFNAQPNSRKVEIITRVFENESSKFFRLNVLALNKDKYDEFCEHAESYANRLKLGEVTTSMIRRIYSRIMSAQNVTDVKMLRPHFAYLSGRNEDKYILRGFMALLDDLVRSMEIDNKKHLNNFKQFMEAIVAYRKYVGDDK